MPILMIGIWLNGFPASAQYFEKVENIPPVQSRTDSRGVIFIDFNRDSHPDIYVVNGPRGGQHNELYLNDANGGFNQAASNNLTQDGSATVGATFADTDHDGDLDGYLANWYNEVNLYFSQDGNHFVSPSIRGTNFGGHSESAAWGDLDNDGFLDLVVANSSFGDGENNLLLRFVKDGFAEPDMTVSEDKVNSRSVNWIDMDGDLDADLFVGNENAPNEIYFNTGDSLIRDTASPLNTVNNTTFGSSWDDVDNDGDFDLFVANYWQLNQVFINDGNGSFDASSLGEGSDFSIGSAFGDIDNDGDLDLFVTNGFAQNEREVPNVLLLNDGNGTFTPVENDPTVMDLGSSYGTAMADYDNDGFLDLFVCNTHTRSNFLFKNVGNSNNWLKVVCTGSLSNYSSIGARIQAKAQINGEEVWQTRHISSQTGYTSQNSFQVHFGFGDAQQIDSLIVTWPSGNQWIGKDLAVNEMITVEEPVNSGQFQPYFALGESTFEDGEFVIKMKNLTALNERDVITYQWDFKNDGVIDSEEFEPAFRSAEAGLIDVRLIVTHKETSQERIRSILIQENLILSVPNDIGIRLFPNPTDSTLSLESLWPIERISILTLDGKSILHQSFPGKHIDISSVSAGNYIVKIDAGGQIITEKIIVR